MTNKKTDNSLVNWLHEAPDIHSTGLKHLLGLHEANCLYGTDAFGREVPFFEELLRVVQRRALTPVKHFFAHPRAVMFTPYNEKTDKAEILIGGFALPFLRICCDLSIIAMHSANPLFFLIYGGLP